MHKPENKEKMPNAKHGKKERQEKKALEAQQDSVSFMKAIDALKNGSFVLEADNVVFRNGIMRFVSSNTNYVEVNDGQGIIQTAFTNFVYNWSPNGFGRCHCTRKRKRYKYAPGQGWQYLLQLRH